MLSAVSPTSDPVARSPVRRFAWLWLAPATLVAAGVAAGSAGAAAAGLGLAAGLALATSI